MIFDAATPLPASLVRRPLVKSKQGPGISRSAPHTGSDGPAQVRGIALSSWRGRYPNQNHVPFAAFFLTALSFALLAYTTGRSGNHIIAAMLAALMAD